MAQHQTRTASLYVLGDRGKTVDRSANDVRGLHVKDNKGDRIGKVADLLVDDQQHKVRFLLVEHGGFLGFGQTTSLIPVDAVTKVDDDVHVDRSGEHVAAAPGYSPDLTQSPAYQSSVYDHYRYAPYWGEGYLDPWFPPSPSSGAADRPRPHAAP